MRKGGAFCGLLAESATPTFEAMFKNMAALVYAFPGDISQNVFRQNANLNRQISVANAAKNDVFYTKI